MWFRLTHMRIKTIQTSNFILDVGMEKEQKQELGWRVSALCIPLYTVQVTKTFTLK